MTTTAPRPLRRLRPRLGRLPRLPRVTRRRLGALLALAAVLLGGWLWLRSSSLVSIRQVRVIGLAGPHVAADRVALTNAALTMTTLNVSDAALERAVAGDPFVVAVHAQPHLPHGVTLVVDERVPVAAVRSDGRLTAVDPAGRLLRADSAADLPQLTAAPDAGGARVTAPGTVAVLRVLAAAPYRLLGHLQSALTSTRHGIVVQLRGGPRLDFGDPARAAAKWAAAIAVLADPTSVGASYIDVSAPDRPAAGTGQGG